jgi:hypothetical protein
MMLQKDFENLLQNPKLYNVSIILLIIKMLLVFTVSFSKRKGILQKSTFKAL